MTKIAIYPGTFDPITNGHTDLIMRGAMLFDQLIVAVAASVRKQPYFDLDTRIDMVRAVVDAKNIEVKPFDGLLVDFVKEQQAKIILRGLRAVSDVDYELQLASMNRRMANDIETLYLPTTENHAFVSATVVREILSMQGDVSPFVPAQVLKWL